MSEAEWLTDEIFTLEGLLSPRRCAELIAWSELLGFEEATVTSPGGNVRVENLRNNERVLVDSQELAEELWPLVKEAVPRKLDGWRAVRLNERFRFYRYDPGQQFDWHQDFSFEADDGDESRLTLLVYLNDGFSGGETSFNDECSAESFDEFSITPATGLGLFFIHSVQHKGEPVSAGRKYVLRTDVMYRQGRKRR